MREIWKKIEGFEYYKVSNLGRVKSLDRCLNVTNFSGRDRHVVVKRKSKILKIFYSKSGYQKVNIYNDSGVKNSSVARLVAIAFINNPNKLDQVNHIDGNKKNNKVTNLEWITGELNHIHAMIFNLKCKGSKRYNSKLNEEIVNKIVKDASNGRTQSDMAREYNVSYVTIGKVLKGITWSHATGIKKDPRAYKVRRKNVRIY